MSQIHARDRFPGRPEKVSVWRHVAAGAGVLFFAGLVAFGPWWAPTIEDSHQTAHGQMLETRMTQGTRDSDLGGAILYRIESHVRYDLHGMAKDRWMAASEVSSDRDVLALRIIKHPSSCEVYWAPDHPENPKCLLK